MPLRDRLFWLAVAAHVGALALYGLAAITLDLAVRAVFRAFCPRSFRHVS